MNPKPSCATWPHETLTQKDKDPGVSVLGFNPSAWEIEAGRVLEFKVGVVYKELSRPAKVV